MERTDQGFDNATTDAGDGPLVSIIMPFLNAERFLQEAVASVFAQTYRDWELLLVDDGSTDASSEIARRCAEQDPVRVRNLEHEGHRNLGASAARNLGLRNARGEFIALLDADDVWLPHKLEEQLAIMAAQPEASMVYGFTEYWFSWTGEAGDLRKDRVPELGFRLDQLYRPPSMFESLFFRLQATTPCTCSILVRREAIERVGGFEDRFLKLYTDQAFYAKLFLEEPVFVASGCWDRYRQHSGSCCHIAEKRGQGRAARRFFLEWLEGYLRENGYEDSTLWRELQRALLRCRHPAMDGLLTILERIVSSDWRFVIYFGILQSGRNSHTISGAVDH